MLSILFSLSCFSVVVFTPSFAVGSHDCSWQRSLAQRYSGKASVQVASNVTAALALAEEHADNVLVTGSLYLVGAALEVLKWPVDDL
jgi:folylpolyglutamate synthase/dihydropteroate synthase